MKWQGKALVIKPLVVEARHGKGAVQRMEQMIKPALDLLSPPYSVEIYDLKELDETKVSDRIDELEKEMLESPGLLTTRLEKANHALQAISSYLGMGGCWDSERLDYQEMATRIMQGIDLHIETQAKILAKTEGKTPAP